VEKTKYMFMYYHQATGQNHHIKAANKSFENVAAFTYLGMTLTNQNSIHEEIKSRLNLGNVCYHTVQNLLSFTLLSKNVKIKIYKTIILPLILYGCETWSLTLKEEYKLRVLGNKVLGRIFGPKQDEVAGGWRKLHNEELRSLYSSPNIIMGGASSTHGGGENVYKIVVGKPEGKRPLGKPRCKWKDNFKTCLRGIWFGDVDWIHLAQDRDRWQALVNTVIYLQVP
jgi:hypothetical protein